MADIDRTDAASEVKLAEVQVEPLRDTTTYRIPVEPVGSLLREELQARGWTCDDLAERTGLPWETIARHVLNERPMKLSAAIANRIGEAMGTSGEFWLNLQAQHAEDQHG